MSLPQRDGRPALNILPSPTPNTAGWAKHFDNLGAHDCNDPAPLRKGSGVDERGTLVDTDNDEAFDTDNDND